MDSRKDGEVVLLVVEASHLEEAIARRDPEHQAVLPIGVTPDDRSQLLAAMGAWHGDFDLRHSRYGNVCVVAEVDRQAGLIAFVARTVWPVVEAEWLHACEPPYDSTRARLVSTAEVRAVLGDGCWRPDLLVT